MHATEKTPIVGNEIGHVASEEGVGSRERYPTQARNKPAYLSEYVVDNIVDDKLAYCSVDYCYLFNHFSCKTQMNQIECVL